jgi:hypothetical protein
VVDFRLFHAPLPIRVIEELEHFIERLLGVVHYVGKCSALPVVQKFFSTNNAHRCHHTDFVSLIADHH